MDAKKTALLLSLLIPLLIHGCKKPNIRTYSVPKEQLIVATLKKEAELHWSVPKHWIQKEASSLRKASYTVPNNNSSNPKLQGDFSLVSFPGKAGGLLANINRWRGQLGLSPIKQTELNANIKSIRHSTLKILFFESTSQTLLIDNEYQQSIFVGILEWNQSTYFFKLLGEKEHLEKEKAIFISLLEGIGDE